MMHPNHGKISEVLSGLPDDWLWDRLKRRKQANLRFQVRVVGYKKQQHGYGETIAAAIQDAVNKAVAFDQEVQRRKLLDPCPNCGTELEAKWSGVACPNEDCGYWFCY